MHKSIFAKDFWVAELVGLLLTVSL